MPVADSPALHPPVIALRDPVTGVNDFAGFMQEAFDDIKLLVTEGRGCNCHFSGTIGKSADSSAHSGCRRRLAAPAQAGADTPGHHLTITALDKAIAFPCGLGRTSAMARARLGFSAIKTALN